MPASALSQQPPQVPEDAGEDGGAPRSNRAGTVIALAKSLCGAAYSDDPQPPERFDAGSFVAYCFAQAGVVLSPSPRAQGFDGDFAAITNTESLAPGDIVCFDTKSDGSLVDHTGIYVGGGYFVPRFRERGTGRRQFAGVGLLSKRLFMGTASARLAPRTPCRESAVLATQREPRLFIQPAAR